MNEGRLRMIVAIGAIRAGEERRGRGGRRRREEGGREAEETRNVRPQRGWRVFPANSNDWLPRWRDQHGRDPIAAIVTSWAQAEGVCSRLPAALHAPARPRLAPLQFLGVVICYKGRVTRGEGAENKSGSQSFLFLFRGGQGDAVKIAVAALGRSGHMHERTRERFAFFVCVRAKVDRG